MPQVQTLKFDANPLRFQRQFARALDNRPAKKLPTLPSKLIRLAVKDMREVRAINQAAARHDLFTPYEFDMSNWFTPALQAPKLLALGAEPGQKCSVCFAGAVMSRSMGLGVDVDRAFDKHPAKFTAEQWEAFEFLDEVRRGNVPLFGHRAFMSKRNRYRIERDKMLRDAVQQIGIDVRKKYAGSHWDRMHGLSNADKLAKPAGFKKFCDAMLYIAKRFEQLGL